MTERVGMVSVSSSEPEEALSFEGNLLVDAGPGTGKTHLIAAKVARLAGAGVDPRRILVLTFSHRAVRELRDRIVRTESIACEVRTFHGFASRLLEAAGPRFRTRRLLGSFAESLLFKTAIERADLNTINRMTRHSKRFCEDAARFASDLRRNNRVAFESLYVTATPRIADLVRIADLATSFREELRASDLDDLIARAVEALEDPSTPQSRWLKERYQHLLIDEFQDVDRVQLTLCERIGGSVFAVGDPAQSIYRFRGAVHRIFDEGAQRLGLERFALHYSRRCPQQICDLAARTPRIGATPLKSLVEAEGSIAVRAARTTLDEAALIADRIEDAMSAGIAPESIAVLLRSMRPLARAVTAELESRRIPVASTGSDAFFNDPDVTVLRLALQALAHPDRKKAWAALFSAPCLGFDATKLRLLIARQRFSTTADFTAWLAETALTGSFPRDHLIETVNAAAAQFDEGHLGRAARSIIRGLRLVEAQTKSSDVAKARTAIARLMRFVDSLSEAQLALASVIEPAGSSDVVDLIDTYAEDLGSDETPSDDVKGVRVMSIHGAKGLQFDLVIIGDAVEGKLPAEPRSSTLLSAVDRAILERANVDVVDARTDDALVEEASLWYVAITRSRDSLFVTYATQGADGTPQRVTRFLPPVLHPHKEQAPFERARDRIESTLLKSSASSARDILATMASGSPMIAAILAEGDAAFTVLEQQPVVLERQFSVSAAEEWLYCPRRFFYHHGLRLRGDRSNSMTTGTMLHSVLERFHEDVTTFGPGSSAALPEWRKHLHEIRSRVSAKENKDPIEVGIARGAAVDRLLDRYAVALAREAEREAFTVRGVESEIVTTLPNGTLLGKPDRVDTLDDGQLVLRDYKTGKMFAELGKQLLKDFDGTKEPSAGDFGTKFKPQIALYRLGAEAKFSATVARLEYIFLKGDGKRDGVATDTVVIDESTLTQLNRLEALVDVGFVGALATGVSSPVATTTDEQNCHFCDFKKRRLCAGVDA